ncbi:MAG TPA: serine/threonine-protein kinase [Burkholderiaceae bacterium]|nr:serine/threonine-protein kinase [Burkholderiaceae bacterium]
MSRPDKLGKYTITGVLGTGAMGVVYTGFDPGIRRSVAIKTIHKKLIDDAAQADSMAARFRNEAQAVGRLLHPGIVAIYEYGEDDSTSFIAMELVQGQSLAKVLTAHTLPQSDVLKLMDQLLGALAYAHRNGVLHRDIKPANLILTAEGVLKVTDFGIARIENIALTQVDLVIGTPGYMAPEQYVGGAIDQRVDVFAAGVLLYRMLTGEAPFAGTYEQVMYKILNETPVAPSQLAGGEALAPYDAIVAKALAKDRDARFQSAAEFRSALAAVARQAGVTGTDTTVVLRQDPIPPRPEPPSGTQLTPITGWDATLLTQFEHALASYIGPMARVLVKQSAKRAVDSAGLTKLLAEHIGTPLERTEFTKRVATLSGTAVSATKARSTTSGSLAGAGSRAGTAPTGTGTPLSEATLEYASKTLARHIGPIAKVVVKKASRQATTREQFFELLADQGPAGADRDQLISELQRAP